MWSEYFMPYFRDLDWHCLAVSWRGHGESGGRESLDTFGLRDYMADVAEVAQRCSQPPVIIGHSLGGLVAQRFSCHYPAAGLALLAPVGPGGLGGAMMHMALGAPDLMLEIDRFQSTRNETPDWEIFRKGLFSKDFSVEQGRVYLPRFQRESRRASFESMIPQWFNLLGRPYLPALVLGGINDSFIPYGELLMTAQFWNADLEVSYDWPHVLMLDQWESAAETLGTWLKKQSFAVDSRS